MIKIYGQPRSSAARCYLVLEELGVPYESKPLDMMQKREHKSPEFLKLNPNGKVPCLVDDDFVVWESLAINHYLAEKFKPELLGTNPKEKAIVQQWNLWSQLELQPPMVDIIIQMMFTPEEKRDMNVVKKANEKIPQALSILEKQFENKNYIAGDKITIADFNLASVVNITTMIKIPMNGFPKINQWMARMSERPSFKKFTEMRGH